MINIEELYIENVILYNFISENSPTYFKSSNIYFENHIYIKVETLQNFLFRYISCSFQAIFFFAETTYSSSVFDFENSVIHLNSIILKEGNYSQAYTNFSAIQVLGNESFFIMNNSYIFNQRSLNGAVY